MDKMYWMHLNKRDGDQSQEIAEMRENCVEHLYLET